MFCTYCQKKRPENESPCPYCGAASPLQKPLTLGNWGTPEANAGSWGNGDAGSMSWGGQASWAGQSPDAQESQWSQAPQASFNPPQEASVWANFAPASPENDPWAPSNNDPWQSPSNASYAAPEAPPQWSQAARAALQSDIQSEQPSPAGYSNWGVQGQAAPEDAGQSMLPVPYQGGQNEQYLPALVQLPTSLAELAPSLPESSVYVPPTFTKPRPLIPRYRIISGMLSLLIVALAACGGLSYLAKTNGTLNTIVRTFTGGAPSQTIASSANLPNPPTQVVDGPAEKQIPVAAVSSSVDPKTDTPLQSTQSFATNQVIYLTFSVPPQPTSGTVTAKWFMNNNFYNMGQPVQVKQGDLTTNGLIRMSYATPSEGYVELYWNGQMAQRLYFVVRSH